MDFSGAARRLMRERGLSQAELSRKSGLSTAYVSQMVNGKVKDPSLRKAWAISDALGVSLDDFRALMGESGQIGA
jgi:transcriptional regulator with XRE-family HTH domain